jgi:hypothetical protein
MYNRLSLLVLTDPLADSEGAFSAEVQQLAALLCCSSEQGPQAAHRVAQACCVIRQAWQQACASVSGITPLTLRSFVRLMHSCRHIQRQQGLNPEAALVAAFDHTLAQQLAGAGAGVVADLRRRLLVTCQVRHWQQQHACALCDWHTTRLAVPFVCCTSSMVVVGDIYNQIPYI